MKKVLVVSICPMRGDSIGLIGDFLLNFNNLDKNDYHIALFDIGFFDRPHNPNRYPVDTYYGLPKKRIEKLMRKLPAFRTKYAEKLSISTFEKIIKKEHYDFAVFYQIPLFADKMTKIANINNVKVAFVPWGSDVLRVSSKERKRLNDAFLVTDYVVGAENTNTIIAAKEIYNVPSEKIIQTKNIVSGVQTLLSIKGKLSREEMSNEVGIPYSDYNIVCSYNGYCAHRHKLIIDSIIKNKDHLPKNYQLVFPMTYGATEAYVKELEFLCQENGINAKFLLNYLSNEQIAYLHCITDLFIEIQPTDNGNAFMIEALCAENKIITGRWLKYKQFEQFGDPYYLIDAPEDLPNILHKILTHQISDICVPEKLIDMYTIPDGYDVSFVWERLFNN